MRFAWLALLGLLGCRVSPPPLEVECADDADCDLTGREATGEEPCCTRCEKSAGRKGWVSSLESYCRDHPPKRKCDLLSCAYASYVVKCEAHKCVVGKGPPIDPEGAPPLEFGCKTDADCGLVEMGANCCSTCKGRPGNRASIQKFHAHCATKPGKDCHVLDCPKDSANAACVNGGCIVRYSE